MRATLVVVVSVMIAAGLYGTVVAGSLDSPGAPSAGSGMYTLQNLYDYIVSGTALEAKTSFQEPSAAPGSTMKTTKEIGDALKSSFDQCNATTADSVEQGKPFFCTQPGSWGVQTGTLSALPRPTATPTITPTPTPTQVWGQLSCEAMSGKWRATQLVGPNDYGCWFYATVPAKTCDEICLQKSWEGHTLGCLAGNWDDDDSCTVCRELIPGDQNCQHTQSNADAPFFDLPNNNCLSRISTMGHDCGVSLRNNNVYQLCVCAP